ncbi:MAG TPA: choice-of-anchor tandem repeat GloVer-containing protein [Candidatus Cybelea sp.]|nr:choice-of-anchor tandem repeat GloVer-containing protein [Candidatus Cybelea sp.]
MTLRSSISIISGAISACMLVACVFHGSGTLPQQSGAALSANHQRGAKDSPSRGTTSSQYRILHTFSGGSDDGGNPYASLIDVNGTLYGTTWAGGSGQCRDSGTVIGCGTVFSISTTGTEKVLYNFSGGSDGAAPYAGLIDVGGRLYGTTSAGGSSGAGTVFRISTAGKEKVLHSFAGSDGNAPFAGLIDVSGKLYGTTYYGGADGVGTVFSITTGGKEKVLYSFKGYPSDGGNPYAGLLDVNGSLYGTTWTSGSGQCKSSSVVVGCGTVFTISTTGNEKVLHSFNGSDGDKPYAGLIDVGSKLFGTTAYGGSDYSGTVFRISASGKEKVLYSFGDNDSAEGGYPFATLIDVNGILYCTTEGGGTTGGGGSSEYGTVFSISTTGNEKVLHSFGGDPDGTHPYAGLIDVNGTLYGTTVYGGHGYGIVFAITP